MPRWSTRLQRFCRRNLSGLLVLCVAAGCMGQTVRTARRPRRAGVLMASGAVTPELPLPYLVRRLVRRSSLIARVQVTEIKKPPEQLSTRWLATVRLLEVLRGERPGEFVQVRAGHVRFEEGEECLLFAEEDIDGGLVAAGRNGKVRIEPAHYAGLAQEIGQRIEPAHYAGLAQEIGQLSIRARHAVSLRATRGPGGDGALALLVMNEGIDPLEFPNDVRVEHWSSLDGSGEPFHDSPIIIVMLETDITVRLKAIREVLDEPRLARPRLTLGGGEACQATLDPRELLPQLTGNHKLLVWAKLKGRLSDPVSLEVDFGNAPRPRRLDDHPREVPSGPFQLTWRTRFHRFSQGNRPALVVLCGAVGCLVPVTVVIGWRRGRARRSA